MNRNVSKTAVITGASRGIGQAMALAFANAGYDLAVCCKTQKDLLAETAESILALGRKCLTFSGDMGNSADVSAFFRQIESHYPQVDVLINNAGISHVGLLQDMNDAEWNGILQSNLSSVFYCCREAIPRMLTQHRGKIINISSVWGETGASMEVAYSATKGGVNALTRALAKELAPSGIQVNAISCGYVDTEMNAQLSDDEKKALFAEIPTGRAATPDEVAAFTVQAASAGSYLTGQILRFDGGWL